MSSSLQDRLRGIVGGTAVPRVSPELTRSQEGEDSRATTSSAPVDFERVAAVVGGSVLESAAGAVVVVDRHYATADRHGRTPIGEIVDTLGGLPDALALLRRAWPSTSSTTRDPGPISDHVWFLDLETTGLAGGAGTEAFLVGCTTVDEEGLHVRQFLLPGLEHERALLAVFGEWSNGRGALVTFNGKSFDVPLFETRYLFHRLAFPLDGVSHVDMLHPARRLWRARGTPVGAGEASCSLSTLERLLAGVHRVGDVAGFDIPSRYFSFVRSGDARPLEAVLEHNRLDLVSLALVLARALTLIDRGPGHTADAYECLGLARLYDRACQPEEAEASYVRAIDLLNRTGRDPETCGDALRRLAWCRRRAGRLPAAVDAWQELANLPRCPSRFRHEAHEALAIHHEHRSRNLTEARSHVIGLLGDDADRRRRAAAEHRLRRLERKLAAGEVDHPSLPLG